MNKFTAQLEKVLMPIAEKVEQKDIVKVKLRDQKYHAIFDHWIILLLSNYDWKH